MSTIEWTDATWNPVRGCACVSPGCESCYAERTAARMASGAYAGLIRLGPQGPRWTGRVSFDEDTLAAPLHWKKPRRVFVNSMSDLFHERLSDEQIAAVFGVMAACPQHTFQVLTKRAERMAEWFGQFIGAESGAGKACQIAANNVLRVDNSILEFPQEWPLPNVWIGVSVEDQQRADERIPYLLQCPAAVRFLSVEPMLGPVDLSDVRERREDGRERSKRALVANDSLFGADAFSRNRVDWVIVGGESGPGARPMDLAWARAIVRQCADAGVACFVKQLGANSVWPLDEAATHAFRSGRVNLRDRKGGDPSEWPEDLRVRQWPAP